MSRSASSALTLMALCTSLLCAPSTPAGSDWPQHLGPQRDGVYPGDDVADRWPAGGPPLVWKRELGTGYSAPVVADRKVLVYHRRGDEDILAAWDAASGAPLWQRGHPTTYRDRFDYDNGPRATPVVSSERVYTFSATGVLSCVALDDGSVLWRKNAFEGGLPESFFGAASSPLIDSGLLIQQLGAGPGAGVAAFDAKTGDRRWSVGDDEASYSSPVAATIGGERHVFLLTRNGLVDIDPNAGKIRSTMRWRARLHASVNAATPLVIGDRVFISECYGPGAGLIGIEGDQFKEIWSHQRVLSNHYVTSVRRAGHLYGLDGRQEARPHLTCVDVETGRPLWVEKQFGTGGLILAGDHLLVVMEDGQLRRVAAQSDRYQLIQKASLTDASVRALPALARGRLYVRSEKQLLCFDLRRASSSPPPRGE